MYIIEAVYLVLKQSSSAGRTAELRHKHTASMMLV